MLFWVVGVEVESAGKWGSLQDDGPEKISQDKCRNSVSKLKLRFDDARRLMCARHSKMGEGDLSHTSSEM